MFKCSFKWTKCSKEILLKNVIPRTVWWRLKILVIEILEVKILAVKISSNRNSCSENFSTKDSSSKNSNVILKVIYQSWADGPVYTLLWWVGYTGSFSMLSCSIWNVLFKMKSNKDFLSTLSKEPYILFNFQLFKKYMFLMKFWQILSFSE